MLGAIDGAITTFAIVAGVVGAGLSAGIVVVLGVANLLADGLSMAASRYLGVQADLERRIVASHRERHHIAMVPEGEREEVRQILAAKGFERDHLEETLSLITAEEDRWVDFMLVDELGFAPDPDRPLVAAPATFGGFVASGLLPIAPFILAEVVDGVPVPSAWSAGLTALAFLVVGAMKAHIVGLARVPSAFRTLVVGGSAAALAFLVGFILRDLA